MPWAPGTLFPNLKAVFVSLTSFSEVGLSLRGQQGLTASGAMMAKAEMLVVKTLMKDEPGMNTNTCQSHSDLYLPPSPGVLAWLQGFQSYRVGVRWAPACQPSPSREVAPTHPCAPPSSLEPSTWQAHDRLHRMNGPVSLCLQMTPSHVFSTCPLRIV